MKEPITKDALEHMFELQAELNKRVGADMDLIPLDENEQAKWSLQYSRAMQQELSEFIDCFPWKWWSKDAEIDSQNAKVEIVDMIHFLISMAQVMGMSGADLYQCYLEKMKVNHNRQEAGYSKETKDHDDSRHIGEGQEILQDQVPPIPFEVHVPQRLELKGCESVAKVVGLGRSNDFELEFKELNGETAKGVFPISEVLTWKRA